MKILLVSAEVAPYSKIGGLSQVIHFLAIALKNLGHDVRIFTPKYGSGPIKKKLTKVVHHISVPTGYFRKKHPQNIVCNILKNPTGHPLTYFLENREYYELRSNVYGYGDDHIRFMLLSRGCLEWIRHEKKKNGWVPDIIHANDWHTAYLCEDIKKNKRYNEVLKNIPVLFTVHNFQMQGNYDFQYLPEGERDVGKGGLPHFFDKELIKKNALLRGILHADWINTVSSNHVDEALTTEYGEGMQDFLKKRLDVFSGILNGIDTKSFDPRRDKSIEQRFSLSNLRLRAKNKPVLQKTFGLPQRDVPILAYSGRLSKQKGIHLILEILPHLLEEYDFQFISLGTGDTKFRNALQKLSKKYPDQVAVHLYPDFELPRKIFSGTDILLMPSTFEPGGIVALEALRYGAVPLVRKTGGLADIVQDFDPKTGQGNGIVFERATSWALFGSIARALELYKFSKIWTKLIENSMKSDFSWGTVAKKYQKLYAQVKKLLSLYHLNEEI